MKAKEFDKKFDDNKTDMLKQLDLSSITRPNQTQKRVNVDFPVWMIELLDREASKLGLPGSPLSKYGWRNGCKAHPAKQLDINICSDCIHRKYRA